MEPSQNIRQQLRDFIDGRLKAKNDLNPFDDTTPLVSSGRMDSLDVIEMVIFLEDKFGLNFAKIGFDQSHVDSVDSIIRLVKQGAA